MTAYEFFNINWNISKNKLKELGIDPNKGHARLTLGELYEVAGHLDISIRELF